jgi:enoyl-CoA hydratase/carnithine racemase
MNFVKVLRKEKLATVVLSRDKVNALNEQVIEQIRNVLNNLEKDPDIKAVILTGENKFFSFGFDIPHFLSYSREEFSAYLTRFTDLYTYLFTFPKPVVAALNGHTIAGGCMLALACDQRIMVEEKAKISLNEITFGSSIFAGSTEMLRFCVGNKHATQILYSGSMYSAGEALSMGLVDKVTSGNELIEEATKRALELGERPTAAFSSLKLLLRAPIAEKMKRREKESINKFVDIWYSDFTFENLKKIKIH